MLILRCIRVIFLGFILYGCGSGNTSQTIAPITTTTINTTTSTTDVSLVHIGDQFVYADANWLLPTGQTNVGKWVVHGTIETPQFGPYSWDQDANGLQNTVPWWTDSNTQNGLLIITTPPANNLYNGSFLNGGVVGQVFIRQHPVVNLSYTILTFAGARARVVTGVSMQSVTGSPFFVEQELQGGFNLCASSIFDRCYSDRSDGLVNIVYFKPTGISSPLVFDVRARLLESPGMTPALADSLQIIGVYVGSEIYGSGNVELLISHYDITAQTQ
jgi:hypothetical protein